MRVPGRCRTASIISPNHCPTIATRRRTTTIAQAPNRLPAHPFSSTRLGRLRMARQSNGSLISNAPPLGDRDVHADVWYQFMPSCSGAARIAACDATFDTKIAVYDAAECPVGTRPTACSDDDCGDDSGLQSSASFEVLEGESRLVRRRVSWSAGNRNAHDRLVARFVDRPALLRPLRAVPFPRMFGSAVRPDVAPDPCCNASDFDADGDVDIGDLDEFVSRMTGP